MLQACCVAVWRLIGGSACLVFWRAQIGSTCGISSYVPDSHYWRSTTRANRWGQTWPPPLKPDNWPTSWPTNPMEDPKERPIYSEPKAQPIGISLPPAMIEKLQDEAIKNKRRGDGQKTVSGIIRQLLEQARY